MDEISQRTLVLLIKDKKVLLGFKKSGFGKGKYLGIGGKVEGKETIIQAAERELDEEINVENPYLTKVADLTFSFPKKPDWTQQVHAYICTNWNNEPVETDEIKPEWFAFDEIPFAHMWDDAQYWIPRILNGEKLIATYIFDENLRVSNIDFKKVNSL